MAHGGLWSEQQRRCLIVLKLSTTRSWKQIAELFRALYETATTHKDCESKYNKDLKNTDDKADWVHYMETKQVLNAAQQEMVTIGRVLFPFVPAENRIIEIP